jgi:hypothetical protein
MTEFDIKSIYGLASEPFVIGLTQLVKTTFPELPARFFPSVSLTIGVLLNVGLGLAIGTALPSAVAVGAIVGLIASGLYAAGKRGE